MISISEALSIHKLLIEDFGGAHGIRDTALLESALNRPFATFDGSELYISPLHKAATLLQSILINHPFIDGNKRTGYVLATLLLMENDYRLAASQEAKYNFVMAISKGELDFEKIASWLEINSSTV